MWACRITQHITLQSQMCKYKIQLCLIQKNLHSQYDIIEWTRQFHGHGAAVEIPCPMKEFYGLNPLQLTQGKEKSSADQGFTGCVNIFLLECRATLALL